ncbi:MAG: hypothetical protein AB8C13_01745 [Phycisphaerales bacterium]
MQIPRYPSERCLLITDSGLGSLILTAMASEQTTIQPTSGDTKQRSTLYPAWWTSCTDMDIRIPLIDRAVEMQADLLSLPMLRDRAGYPDTDTASDASTDTSMGAHQNRMLLDAATLAISMGIKRVIWPIHSSSLSGDGQSGPVDHLEQVGRAIDRALLTARLATLDAQDYGGVEVMIETPLVDLNDAQLSDLAADLNIPIHSCWFSGANSVPDAALELNRWAAQPIIGSMLEHRPQTHQASNI